MRKIFTLLFSLIVLSASAFARPDSTCNASFTFSIDNSTNIVQFVAAGANTTIPVEHSWSFGDGTGFFGLFSPNPTHYYVNAGIYQVMHVVTYRSPNDSTAILCSDSVSMIVTIINRAPCNVQANFFTSTNSMFPNDIGFNNTTTGFTNDMQFRWDFGDGTSTNSINHYSTVHTYQQPGTYLACLSVSRDSACSSDTCKVVVIQGPNSCNLVANFSSNADSSDSQLIYFTNTSTPQSNSADSVQWSFGDGTISTENNPSHLYNQPGVYRVCLYINRLNGTSICRSEYCSNVIIDTPQNACNLTASFTYQLSPITVPFSFSFANTSTPLSNVDSSFWNFGDGSAIEVNRNVTTHSFRNPGVYDVCLTVKKVQPGTINTICERQTCQRIIIDTPQTQCNIQAYFGYRPDSTVVNKIYFTNVSSSLEPTDSVFWTFGDGGYSTDVNPVHTYNAGGTYNVCLRIERPQTAGTAPCVREYCGQVLVQQPANPCNLVVNFFDSVVNNNTFYFINQSTPIASTDSSRWSFGDGTSSNDINAIHTYNQPGTYTVC